ncbi:MAG TPA: hypothetical protein VFV68_09685, partial [Agriterribacter sp.]|nr:hypothetical protein [Agriterribacter sp.]
YFFTAANLVVAPGCFTCNDAPAGTIFCDDFETDEDVTNRYFGYDDDDGEFTRIKGVGRDGSAGMRVKWQKGEVEAGVLQKSIGRSPDTGMGKTAFPEKDFNEIYWRIDVKNEKGWEGGGGDKLTRATVIASEKWQQGMIAHIWSGGKEPGNNYLVMDPATGISEDGKLVSEHYNDFSKLRWLGNKSGTTDIFSTAKTGVWNCIVAHVKLNTPGKSDGIFEFWINDKLQAGSYDLNWHADWNTKAGSYMINAVFFENYWNKGSVKDQERYFDNILISTKPISCHCSVEEKAG